MLVQMHAGALNLAGAASIKRSKFGRQAAGPTAKSAFLPTKGCKV